MSDLTFGQKAVGITFNPSGDQTVVDVKQHFADVIDLLVPDGNLDNGATGLKGRILGRAINDAIVAQMLAVKYLTFPSSTPAADTDGDSDTETAEPTADATPLIPADQTAPVVPDTTVAQTAPAEPAATVLDPAPQQPNATPSV